MKSSKKKNVKQVMKQKTAVKAYQAPTVKKVQKLSAVTGVPKVTGNAAG